MPVPIEVVGGESQELLMGQVVQAINALIATNKEDHEKIFQRLDDGDKYLAILKFSRCSIHWLDRQGFFKVLGTILVSGAVGYFLAHSI